MLYLNEKGSSNKTKNQDKDKNMNMGSDTDKFFNQINKYFRDVGTVNNDIIDKTEGDKKSEETRKVEKQRKEDDIVLEIEKTFGGRISFLIFYFIFLLVILIQVVKRNDVNDRNKFYTAIKNEFENSDFSVINRVQDFLYTNQANETSDYQVSLNLNEVNDVRILPIWFYGVFLDKLGFFTRKFEFIEKHKLIGKMRFLQIRSKNNSEDCIKMNTDLSSSNQTQYCYSEAFEEEKDSKRFFCNKMTVVPTLDNVKKGFLFMDDFKRCIEQNFTNPNFLNPCINKVANSNSTKNTANNALLYQYNPFICELLTKGTDKRPLNKINLTNKSDPSKKYNISEKFVYSGELNSYSYENASYFDIPLDYVEDVNKIVNQNRLYNFANYLFNDWVDVNTRLLMISFNCYQTILDQDSIFSVTLYIEFSKTQALKKKFEINFYSKYIDFDNINFNTIFQSFSYFIFLFLYSSIHLYFNIMELIKEKLNIFYKQFTLFIINLSINSLILLVLVFRILTALLQTSYLNPYKENGFQEYFPINYYQTGSEQFVVYLEITMISLITLNTLNSFYFQFFARVFLTFKFAWKYLFAYLVIYFIIIVAYAASCNILYGSYITCKNILDKFFSY